MAACLLFVLSAVAGLEGISNAERPLNGSPPGPGLDTAGADAARNGPAESISPPADGDPSEPEIRKFDPPKPRRATFVRQNNKAVIVPFDRQIEHVLYESMKRRVELARQMNADVIIFRFQTPGGLVSASKNIVDLLLETDDIYTVAYVDREAISGGALVAFACDEIVMHPLGRIGDVLPVVQGTGGKPERVGTKAETYVGEVFQTIAEENGYNPLLLKAMVNPDLKVWLLLENDTDTIDRIVNDAELGQLRDRDDFENTWDAELLIDKGQVLTLSAKRAARLGLATRLIDTDAELFEYLGVTNTPPPVLGLSSSERLLFFLNLMAPLLFTVGLISGYIAITTPGTGIPEAVAAVALIVAFTSQGLVGHEVGWGLVAVFIGVALLAVELFVIPGFGVTGIVGIVFVVGGVLVSFIPKDLTWKAPADTTFIWTAILKTILTMGLAGLGLMLAVLLLPKTRLALPFMLSPSGEVSRPAPIVQQMGPHQALSQAADEIDEVTIGQHGLTVTRLRPSGLARLGDKRLDVVTRGEYLEKGVPIRVDAVEGMRIVVSEIPEDELPAAGGGSANV